MQLTSEIKLPENPQGKVVGFYLDLPPMGKQRARVCTSSKGKSYSTYKQDYIDWMEAATFDLRNQWHNHGFTHPLDSVQKIIVLNYGTRASVDSDNLEGSVLDAMVKAGIIRNDNVKVCPHTEQVWQRCKKGEPPHIEVIMILPVEI
ncbi:UNVERIFIED_CONTAM: hypothetical protein BEN50_10795 [Euhalothece sp. KZN 001]